ncbi:MAG: zf-HC2 domain-containing protein [Bryobacteraceae bacterium]
MKHPSEATLALYAGGDLSWFARRRTQRHLARCEPCRLEAQGYRDLRAALPELSGLPPGVHWGRLSAEMKANIRLGLEAGECVRAQPEALTGSWLGGRALVAYASVAALFFAGVLLERPAPRPMPRQARAIVLQTTSGGIEWNDGRQALRIMHAGAENVTVTVGAQGSMRARYVDGETGYVTVNNVYVQ